jgi:Predicted metal-dependent hydrolase with the TIM-barrel fold
MIPATRLLSDEMHPPSAMRDRLMQADAAGLQLRVHAIGDRAISMMLDIFADIEKEHGYHDQRFAIEHAQHRRKKISSVSRNSTSSRQCSLTTQLTTAAGRKRASVTSERATATRGAAFLDHGVTLAFGTDWPVARSTRCWEFTPQSRAPRSTGKIPAAGFQRKKLRYRKRSKPTPWARHSPNFRKRERLHYTRQTRRHGD